MSKSSDDIIDLCDSSSNDGSFMKKNIRKRGCSSLKKYKSKQLNDGDRKYRHEKLSKKRKKIDDFTSCLYQLESKRRNIRSLIDDMNSSSDDDDDDDDEKRRSIRSESLVVEKLTPTNHPSEDDSSTINSEKKTEEIILLDSDDEDDDDDEKSTTKINNDCFSNDDNKNKASLKNKKSGEENKVKKEVPFNITVDSHSEIEIQESNSDAGTYKDDNNVDNDEDTVDYEMSVPTNLHSDFIGTQEFKDDDDNDDEATVAYDQHDPITSKKDNNSNINCPISLDSDSDMSTLLSPTPFSPTTTSKLSKRNNQYYDKDDAFLSPFARLNRSKKKVPIPPLPLINEISGKLYPDLRHQFIMGLMEHAKMTRRASHSRHAFDTSLRAIVIFSVIQTYPIRTAVAATHIKGIGKELLNVLNDTAKQCKKKPYYPPKGKCTSVAAAALIALLNYEEYKKKNEENDDNATKNTIFCTMETLIRQINFLLDCRVGLLNRPLTYYIDKNTLDPGWGQVRKLCSTAIGQQLLKERRNKQACTSGVVFELTDDGRRVAQELKLKLQQEPASLGPLRQLAASEVDEEYGNVTMSMDFREGGGGTRGLHKMCDLLDEHCVPYVVRELKISDYVFFVDNKLAPILIERKSAEDVAGSIADGRWERQKRNMRKAQYVLGNGECRKCQICYIIEGDASRRTVHGGNVGRVSWDQSLENVERAIEKLPRFGFSVMKSKSVMGSMLLLAKIARDVAWKYKNGSIDASLTYDDFLTKINETSARAGDPLNPATEQEHMFPAAPVPDAETVDNLTSTQQQHSNRELTQSLQGANISRSQCIFPESPMSDIDAEEKQNEDDENHDKRSELEQKKTAELKQMCKDRDEKQSGNKIQLIERLLKPRKPEVLILRSRRGQYVPKVPSCNAALMIALLLNHRPGTEGISKESLMMLAEETGVSKESMGGNGGWYDGWAGMKDLLHGDPALVCVSKRQYSLTTQPAGSAGRDIAKALHILAHREKLCRCGAHL